jgi:hypothetical protein
MLLQDMSFFLRANCEGSSHNPTALQFYIKVRGVRVRYLHSFTTRTKTKKKRGRESRATNYLYS